MRKLGYGDAIKHEKDKFVDKTSTMLPEKELPSEQTTSQEISIAQEQEAEISAFENELKLVKKELETAKIKAIAYSRMIDIAEKNLIFQSEKSNLPNHRRNKNSISAHRISLLMSMVWSY